MTPAPDPASPPPSLRLRDGWITTLLLIGAVLLLYAITHIDVIFYAPQHDLFLIGAALLALAIPGPILRLWDIPGRLMLWNATGWCLALLVFGMASIGATTMFPLILIAVAITFWPRADDRPIPWLALSIALAGGFVACWLLWDSAYAEIPFSIF